MSASCQLSSKLPCQVAAICYRRGPSGIEFLLVNTDGGKWTFPKGSIEPHLPHSEAAVRIFRFELIDNLGVEHALLPVDSWCAWVALDEPATATVSLP